jgi:hypothetical protein
MDMRFVTWNVRLYRAGSLVTASKELSKYKLDLAGVQEVRWEKVGTELAGEHTLFHRKRNETHKLCTDFLCKRESYQQLREFSLIVIGCHSEY